MLTRMEGVFVKIAFASEAHRSLAQNDPNRPAARFNRSGQDALYLSPDEASARVAIGQYIRPDDPPRVLQRFEISACDLYDLRHPEAAEIYELARQPWLGPLSRGDEPPSWVAADRIRTAGHPGLIDPSRRQPGLWHITLFGWNALGFPAVAPKCSPEPMTFDA